jgi:N6-L-threonylcarbamoyladenine synthase
MAEFHSNNAYQIIKNALQKANLELKDINIIAFSQGPGIPQCLRIGAIIARCLSLKYNKSLIGVNHGIGHIEIGKLTTSAKDPVILLLSGGHTAVITFIDKKYRFLGETMDITLGNALDMLARKLGLQMPGGIEIEKLAKNGKYFELPYVVKGMDLSFSGLVTEALRKFKQGIKKEDVAYSFQETCFAMLTEVTERAVAHTDKEEVLLVGGVAANKRLQEMLRIMTEERGAKFFVVPQEYSGDCGINIAWTGILAKQRGYELSIEKSQIKQKWRIDEVEW